MAGCCHERSFAIYGNGQVRGGNVIGFSRRHYGTLRRFYAVGYAKDVKVCTRYIDTAQRTAGQKTHQRNGVGPHRSDNSAV